MKKTAIVTGGSRGIGFAISARLAKDGFNIVVAGTRDEQDCRENLNLLEKTNTACIYVKADVSSAEGRKKIIG